jgi:ketosteroid isomerase-like protein
MLSEDALRALGNLERAQIERRVRRIYDLWAHGDIGAMIDEMSPDVKMAPTGHWVGAAAPMQGRAAAAAELRKAGALLENIVSVLHEVVIDGDRVVVHRTAVGRWRESGRRYQCDFIDFFRFRDALIVEFSQYPDSGWIEAQATS